MVVPPGFDPENPGIRSRDASQYMTHKCLRTYNLAKLAYLHISTFLSANIYYLIATRTALQHLRTIILFDRIGRSNIQFE